MEDNQIDKSVIIEGDVRIGSGNKICQNVVLLGPLEIGDNNYIGANSIIGALPENAKTMTATDLINGKVGTQGVVIGAENIIRESCVVHGGISRQTHIANKCWIHSQCHIDHDDIVMDGVVLAPCVALAGYVTLMPEAQLGLSATVHQNRTVGGMAMVGMNATVVQDVVPCTIVRGSPARSAGINRIRLERMGLDADAIKMVDDYVHSKKPTPDKLDQRLRDVFELYFRSRDEHP